MAGEELRRGKKKVRAESKRLVGEGCRHLALQGSTWTRTLKEAVGGHPAPIWSLSPTLLGWPGKVSLSLQRGLG